MIIVGQEKDIIINFNNIESIEIGNVEENGGKAVIYVRTVSDYFYKIGEYATEERAKEVLKKIIESYELTENYKNLGKDFILNTELIDEYSKKVIVYKMPKE